VLVLLNSSEIKLALPNDKSTCTVTLASGQNTERQNSVMKKIRSIDKGCHKIKILLASVLIYFICLHNFRSSTVNNHKCWAGKELVLNSVRFEVFTAMTMKNAVFWDVELCRYFVNRRYSETSVNKIFVSARRHIPEDGILHGIKLFDCKSLNIPEDTGEKYIVVFNILKKLVTLHYSKLKKFLQMH
jgi:hypothetical protein